MYNLKTLLAAGTMAAALIAGTAGAQAAPRDRHDHHPVVRYEQHFAPQQRDHHHRLAVRERVYDTLRLHRYRAIGAPVFVRGHYVVRSVNRMGRIVLVEVHPYTGRFMGEIRI